MLTDPPDVRPATPARGQVGRAASVPAWLLYVADARRLLVLAGLAAAILLPSFSISSRLPDVRVEQLLLPYALLVLGIDRRLGRRFQVGFLDWIFAGLALSTLLSILLAPLILRTHVSPRDFYELLKLALYYGLYRLAISAFEQAAPHGAWVRGRIAGRVVESASLDRLRMSGAGEIRLGRTLPLGASQASAVNPLERGSGKRPLADVLFVAGGISAVFAVFQYFDWLHVNAWLTPAFAPEPHLGVLRQSGRVVGTFPNPNYFGIFCAVLLLGCLASVWLSAEGSGAARRLGLVSGIAALASVGIIMSGSRTSLLALAVALGALLAFGLFVARRAGSARRLVAGAAVLLLMLAGSVLLVQRFPHGSAGYLARVGDGALSGDDASLNLRLARWRSVLDAWLPRSGESASVTHAPLTSVHATGVAPAAPDALARDTQRKQDLLRLANAIDAYHRTTGAWPAPDALPAALVPRYLPALPLDPATQQPYPDIATVSGYSLLARLENAADPDFPIYGIGSSPNYLLNGDLEQGGGRPANWDGIPGSSFALQQGDSLYGDHAVLFRGDPGRPEARAGIYQQRYFGRPGGNPFTATVWIKLLGPADGTLELYANTIYDDGSRADPLTRIPADMTKVGVWQKVSLGILPPAGKTLAFLGVYVVSENYRSEALLDGFQLVDGTVPLSFAITREAPPSDTLAFNPEARLRASPLIGVGPEKGEQSSALDDEYLLYAARYGVVGMLLYLALYIGTLVLAVRAFLRGRPSGRPLAALAALTMLAFLVFNITAGSFYELQLMAIFWLLAGAALSVELTDAEVDNPSIA